MQGDTLEEVLQRIVDCVTRRLPVTIASIILLNEERKLTLAVGSKLFLYEQRYLWGDFAAAAILSGLPITVVFILAQKWMVSGLTSGGLKG